jgi:hypothetical protein
MIGDPIADAHHVARFCRKSSIDEDGRVAAGAFMLRKNVPGKGPEDCLSVNWLEKLEGGSTEERLQVLRHVHPLKNRTEREKFAVLNVGNARTKVHEQSTDKRWLRILERPSDSNPSHAAICGTAGEDEDNIAHILADCILFSVPAITDETA